MNKILIIQTAFIGDAILSTSVAEELHEVFPNASITLLIRKGNESLFDEHPFIRVWTHNKADKYNSLFSLLKKIRNEKFDAVINLHRYSSSAMLTVLSGANIKVGFQSIFSFFMNYSVKHAFNQGVHEINRYHSLTKYITQQDKIFLPKLYPQPKHFEKVKEFVKNEYVCLFPSSVWATKQLPPHKWVELINRFSDKTVIYLCGASADKNLCEYILQQSKKENIKNIAGQLSLIETAALMATAKRCYVNDSAPLHIASALNTPITAFFCSTVTNFGFYPLSADSQVLEVENLSCRPCGVHGHKECPKKYFECGLKININEAKL